MTRPLQRTVSLLREVAGGDLRGRVAEPGGDNHDRHVAKPDPLPEWVGQPDNNVHRLGEIADWQGPRVGVVVNRANVVFAAVDAIMTVSNATGDGLLPGQACKPAFGVTYLER
jgi:hypothetical protein